MDVESKRELHVTLNSEEVERAILEYVEKHEQIVPEEGNEVCVEYDVDTFAGGANLRYATLKIGRP